MFVEWQMSRDKNPGFGLFLISRAVVLDNNRLRSKKVNRSARYAGRKSTGFGFDGLSPHFDTPWRRLVSPSRGGLRLAQPAGKPVLAALVPLSCVTRSAASALASSSPKRPSAIATVKRRRSPAPGAMSTG